MALACSAGRALKTRAANPKEKRTIPPNKIAVIKIAISIMF